MDPTQFDAKLIDVHLRGLNGISLTKKGLKSTALRNGSSLYVLITSFLTFVSFSGVIASNN